MTDLIKQIEAKIDELSWPNPTDYNQCPVSFKACAQSLMPLIEFQQVQFEKCLSVFAENMVITDQLKNDLIETYRRQLLELLNQTKETL